MSGWLPAEPEPDKEVVDWDMYLGPAAWRPFNAKLLDGFNFEKGWRAGWRRRAGMGLALRRPVPMGRWRR